VNASIDVERFANSVADEMERYARTSVNRSKEQGAFHWVTIGSQKGEDGENHGGHPVLIDKEGRMQSGKFAGKTMGQAFGNGNSPEKPDGSNPKPFKPTLIGEHGSAERSPSARKSGLRAMLEGVGKKSADDILAKPGIAGLENFPKPPKSDPATWSDEVSPGQFTGSELRDYIGKRGKPAGSKQLHDMSDNEKRKAGLSEDEIQDLESSQNYFNVVGNTQAASDADLNRAHGFAGRLADHHERSGRKELASSIRLEQDSIRAEIKRRNEQGAAKPGIQPVTRPNESAKAGDQLGLFGQAAVPKRDAAPTLPPGGESKGKQQSLFDTKGSADQGMLFKTDDAMPDDMVGGLEGKANTKSVPKDVEQAHADMKKAHEQRKTGRNTLGSYFAEKNGRFVRVDGKDAADVALFERAGYKRISEPVGADSLTEHEVTEARRHYAEWLTKPPILMPKAGEGTKEPYTLRHPMHAAKPTQAQAEAGNYRMGHIRIHGLDISIETPKGRSRRDGWPILPAHYGYIRGTIGRDGDHIDVFVGPDRSSEMVYVIDQITRSGKWDEHKCLLGFRSQQAAVDAYRKAYSFGQPLGKVTAMTIGQFRQWLAAGNKSLPIHKQVGRYDLWLNDDAVVDRYEWNEAAHPRHSAGSTEGGQFASGNRPGGSLSPRMLATAQEKWKSTNGGPWETVPSPAVQQLRKAFDALKNPQPAAPAQTRDGAPQQSGTKVRELPEHKSVAPTNALHYTQLPQQWRSRLIDWSNAISREMMPTIIPPTERRMSREEYFEQQWAAMDKTKLRGLLNEMNQMDREARAQGIRLSDYVNASAMIPQTLAKRLHGGARFFDQSRIADKINAADGKSDQSQDITALESHRRADRRTQKQMEQDPHILAAIHKALGLTPPKPKEPKPEPMPEPTPFPTEKVEGDGLSTRQRNLIDAALQNRADIAPDELPDLRSQVLDTWQRMNDERKQHNEGLRSILTNFGVEGAKRSALTTALRRGSDYDKIPGFDEMVSWAREHLPHLLIQHRGSADTGSDEESLAKAIIDGSREELQPWHDEVIDDVAKQIVAGMASYNGPEIDESVPFSARFAAEVERYLLTARKSSLAHLN